ncbi:MAG: 3-hydroxyisobutyrate dehydrogenase [Solirubrobacteraceae bacterium]|nr:3-hydroxyisobutyrate dehydrogenase [Solirubrobacteraceae bacterium]
MSAASPDVAVLGTGIMGAPMARNIARAGLAVRAWNRTPERALALERDGATVAATVTEAVTGADVVITMLADADATLAVAAKALEAMGAGAIWVQAGTIGVEAVERCAQMAQRHGVAMVDAPVLGTREPAEDGALVVLAAGPAEAVDRCSEVFTALAQRTVRAGGTPGDGTRLKLVVNTWVLALLQGTAETVALAKGLGVGLDRVLEAIDGGPLDTSYFRTKSAMMEQDDYPPSFTLRLAAKDAALIREAAERNGRDLPMVAAIAERLAAGVDAGHGDEDMAATYRLSAPDG